MINKNFIIILSSPSGAGKSTISKMLLDKYDDVKLSISATTRQPRVGEVDGKHYYFITQDDFNKRLSNDDFLEYAGVYEKKYGTLKSEVERIWDSGSDVLLDIDWQGSLLIQKQITDKTRLLTIFLLPPNIKELRNRLEKRGTETQDLINKRMADAKNTILHCNEYEHLIVNDDLEEAFNKICNLIEYKRRKNDSINELIVKVMGEEV
jgi:guanylate kinase